MADTGAPWNLRYPLPTDLVKDGAEAIEDLALDVAAGLSIANFAGIGKNAVQTVKTDPFSVSAQTTFTNVTGLSVAITPTSNTSKVLVIAHVSLGDHEQGAHLRINGGGAENYVGDAASSRVRAATTINGQVGGFSAQVMSQIVMVLTTPNTTSPVTYQVQIRTGTTGTGSTAYINRSHTDGNNAFFARVASSITAIEVAV
jgi:hypothetical protein